MPFNIRPTKSIRQLRIERRVQHTCTRHDAIYSVQPPVVRVSGVMVMRPGGSAARGAAMAT